MVTRRTWISGLAIAIAAVAAGAVAVAPSALARGRVETPKYSVVSSHAKFEVRRYEPRLVAEVTVTGTSKQASNAGFRILADFIFGNNEAREDVAMTAPVDQTASSEAIAMTAPVDQTAAAGETWVIAFTMPSQYTLETLPKPRDGRVRIRELPAKSYAVWRFSGAPSQEVVGARMAAFEAMVVDAGLEPSGAAPTYARYDPPWTPSFVRRNEIFIELKG